MSPSVGTLRAVTRPLERGDGPLDLLDVCGRDGLLFLRDGVGLAGRGEVARVPVHEARAVLAAIAADDTVGLPGCGPVGFAAFPFHPDAPAEVVIPAEVVGRAADGTTWRTEIRPAHPETSPTVTAPPGPPPEVTGGAFTLRPGRPPAEWTAAVAEARRRIRNGALQKVVLARDVLVEADTPIDRWAVLRRLRASFGSSHLFCVDGFLGASPELLVSRHGDVVRSHPLAGTVARTGDPATDARLAAGLLASAKDQHEHRVVIDAVHAGLLPYVSYLDEEAEPSIVTVANVQHLGTLLEGRLSAPAAHVLELVWALHPTPAIGGAPTAVALEAIAELEGMDRGPYAGAVGWFDQHGNGTFAVSIRCAQVHGTKARLFSGVGVVADSDPAAELAETQAKLQAMLSAIVRP